MPIAKPDNARTQRGTPVVIAVLGNDEGNSLSIVGHSLPATGTLVLNVDQTFTYTPNAGFEGEDAFAYTVRDIVGGTAQGEVSIRVARPNSAPIARSDSAQVLAGASVDLAVLANDNDLDGDALAIIGIDAPGHGTVRVLPNQTIRYTPQTGFDGIDGFTYTVGDGKGEVGTANVTVAVRLPNLPPQARPDLAVAAEGASVAIDALANDNDPEGGPVSLSGYSMPGHGSLTLAPDRRFIYRPAAGFVGTDSFSYDVRDGQGAAATGQVTVTVESANVPPIVNPDVATSGGGPVTLDVLANDNDPDGDPLRLSAITLPIEGAIMVEPDGRRVTYTPASGFSGVDSFTYQVNDGSAIAEGEVFVTVTAPAHPTYANGYRFRRRIVIPPQVSAAETATDFVLSVREVGAWLKSVAQGGRVESPQGFDLRFELEDGTKLDHEIERYGSAEGALISWVRLPSIALGSPLRLFLYYGKPGLAQAEANPSGVWRGYLAVLDPRTGADRTAGNRSLTPTGISAGELIGAAGAYGGSSVARRADATFLSALDALTVQAVIAPEPGTVGSSRGVLAQGPMDGSDASAGLALQYLAQSADGTRNVIHFKLGCDDGAAFVVSGANAQRAQPQLLHGVWRRGETASLFLDGVKVLPSSASPARTGRTLMPAGALHMGAGARDPATGGWIGLIDEVRFAAKALSAAQVASEAANLSSTQALYGIGGEDEAGQTDQSPVAVPLRVACPSGSSVDIDVAAGAYDPDGPGLPEIVAVGAARNGVVTVVGGKVRYTPFAGLVGPDRLEYTLDNAGKRSTSIVLVTVASLADYRPKLPSAAIRTLRVPEDYATFALAYAAARGGDHISLASGTYAGSINLNRSFPTDRPLVIRSRSTGGAAPGAVFTGNIRVSAPGHWLFELQTNLASSTPGNADITLDSSHVWVTRCWLRGRQGIQCGSTVNHVWIGWNRFTGRNLSTGGTVAAPTAPNVAHLKLPVPASLPSQTAGPHDFYCYRNFFWDDADHRNYAPETGGESTSISIGDVQPAGSDVGTLLRVMLEENYFASSGTGLGRPRSIYATRGCDIFRNRTILSLGEFGMRHGWGARIWGNRVAGSAFSISGDPRAGGFASGNDLRNNVSTAPIRLLRASYRPTNPPSAFYQAADWTTLLANDGALVVGYFNSTGGALRDTAQGGTVGNVRVFQHRGTVTLGGPQDAIASSISQSPTNPLALEVPAIVSATFDGDDTGFQTGDQGLLQTVPVDLFLNPFNKDSSHHRPLGANVRYGIPPGTLDAKVANPSYDAGILGSRGRIADVGTFRVGSTKQGQKYLHRVSSGDSSRLVQWQTAAHGGGDGVNLPITLKTPAPSAQTPYSDDPSGDNEVLLYPRNGNAADLADVFPEYNYESVVPGQTSASARGLYSYPIAGGDVRNLYNDPDTALSGWGPGAIDWRHPAGFLRGYEVDLTGGTPIRHVLNATATRHSGQGATAAQHVLSRRMAYPAWNHDRPFRNQGTQNIPDNQGDIPYGAIIAIRWQDRGMRETLGLTPFGKQLFDTFLYFGCCLCDGQGQVIDNAPVLQLRVDWVLARDPAKEAAVEAALTKVLPHLWPVFNPRRHTGETERHTDGLCYVGGGGPLGPGSVNTAWDAD